MEKNMNRGIRRKKDYCKAKRKEYISKEVYGVDWYDNLHQYSKNKVHCSCPMCASKTNLKKWRGSGKRYDNRSLYGTSYGRKGKNWSMQDIKRIQNMTNAISEYLDLQAE